MRSVISVFHKAEKGHTEQHKLLGLYIRPDSVNHCANSVEFI